MGISILKDVLLCIVTSCFAFLISEEKIAMRLFMYASVLLASENISLFAVIGRKMTMLI